MFYSVAVLCVKIFSLFYSVAVVIVPVLCVMIFCDLALFVCLFYSVAVVVVPVLCVLILCIEYLALFVCVEAPALFLGHCLGLAYSALWYD